MSPEIQQVRPKYLQVADHIRGQILRGELQPGDEIPSERGIVDEWGVSRPTATRALATLRTEGLVESRQGAGTFVRPQPRLNRRARDRYLRSQDIGRAYTGNEYSEITLAEVAPAPAHVATALLVEAGTETIRRRRVIYDADDPVEVSTSWFHQRSGELAPRLLHRERILEGTIAYLESATGRKVGLARDRYTARLAEDSEARALQLDQPQAVLVAHHTSFDVDGAPLEFTEAVFPPGRWVFEDEYPLGP